MMAAEAPPRARAESSAAGDGPGRCAKVLAHPSIEAVHAGRSRSGDDRFWRAGFPAASASLNHHAFGRSPGHRGSTTDAMVWLDEHSGDVGT